MRVDIVAAYYPPTIVFFYRFLPKDYSSQEEYPELLH
jgi:hypothetical protein